MFLLSRLSLYSEASVCLVFVKLIAAARVGAIYRLGDDLERRRQTEFSRAVVESTKRGNSERSVGSVRLNGHT